MKSSHAVGCGLLVIAMGILLVLADQLLPSHVWHSPVGRVVLRVISLIGAGGSTIPSSTSTSEVARVKAQMTNLKTGLICYQNDLGKPPFVGPTMSAANLERADTHCLGTTYARNVLVNDTISKPFENLGLPIHLYRKRWKGPYMDSDPAEFMNDPWGKKIVYTLATTTLFLHCGGPDAKRDPLVTAIALGYAGDDITITVMKLKHLSLDTPGAISSSTLAVTASAAAEAPVGIEPPTTLLSSEPVVADGTASPTNR
ncbi:MAG TPA: hypothetical protein PKO06_14595 [Candidatus Ozemobacteraceae bacterium]|nr:hypothetical protein [Candidatus Ozemobacteraceae bacterium]